MAKKSEKPQFFCLRRGNTLVPEMTIDSDLIQRLPSGQRIKITVEEGRSPSKLRLYWAYLGKIVAATECAPSSEVLHDIVKLHIGYVVPVMVKGFPVAVPKSISFASMDETEFDNFLRSAEKWLVSTYGVSIADAFAKDAAA